jgi:hypothetical protein
MSRPEPRFAFWQQQRRLWRAILVEPLCHFALLGGLLYAGYLWRNPPPPERIVVPKELVEARRSELQRRTGHPPNPEQVQAAIADYVDSEVLFREAARRRLGDGDVIVRRRLIQKMEYVAEALVPRQLPTDVELAAILHAHSDRYSLPARTALRQVFVSHERHPHDAESVAQSLLIALRSGRTPDSLGDPHPLGPLLPLHSEAELAQLLSSEIATKVNQLSEGEWSPPLRSAHGLHLLQVTARQSGQLPTVSQLRERLLLDYLEQQRPERQRRAITELRKRYQIVWPVDGVK